jgi:hypothetical protein
VRVAGQDVQGPDGALDYLLHPHAVHVDCLRRLLPEARSAGVSLSHTGEQYEY